MNNNVNLYKIILVIIFLDLRHQRGTGFKKLFLQLTFKIQKIQFIRIAVLFLMMFVFLSKSFSQVKVQEKVPQIIVLKTMELELEDDFYSHTFLTGYEYPAIQQGFYAVSLISKLDGLILFYTELSNLSNMEDGKYTLTMKISSSNSTFKNVRFVALKKGKKINLLSSSSAYAITLAKFKIEYLQEDLNTIKALIKQ